MQILAVKPDARTHREATSSAAAAVVLRSSRAHQASRDWITERSVTCNILKAEEKQNYV